MKAKVFEADFVLAHFQLPLPVGAQTLRRAARADAFVEQTGRRPLNGLPVGGNDAGEIGPGSLSTDGNDQHSDKNKQSSFSHGIHAEKNGKSEEKWLSIKQ